MLAHNSSNNGTTNGAKVPDGLKATSQSAPGEGLRLSTQSATGAASTGAIGNNNSGDDIDGNDSSKELADDELPCEISKGLTTEGAHPRAVS